MKYTSYISILIVIGFFSIYGGIFSHAQEKSEEPVTQPTTQKYEPTDNTTDNPIKYDPKLMELEEKVIKLKEDIFTTKTRVKLLKERIFQNTIAESRAILIHSNDMGNKYKLEEAIYYLDGNKVYHQDNKTGVLDERKEFTIFNRSVGPGSHIISVELYYRGYGVVFTYLNGYHFKLKTNFTFHVARGRITEIKVIGYERKNFTYSMVERPSIKYEIRDIEITPDSLSKIKEKEEKKQPDL
jgi:hypothetical protein